TAPRCTRQCPGWCSLPTLRMNASPASNTRTRASGSEWYVPPRWQTVCRLSRRMRKRSYREGRVCYWSEGSRVEHKGPTPAAEYLACHTVLRELEAGEAPIKSAGNEHESCGCRVKRKTRWG